MRTLIVIPTYNELENINKIFIEINSLSLNLDVLFIDDNSPDGTSKEIENLQIKNKNVFLIKRPEKLGVGSAHKDAIKWAYKKKYDYLVTMDCDFTHSPKLIVNFIRDIKDSCVLVGSRFLKSNSLKGWKIHRKIMTHLGHFLTKNFVNLPYDSTGAFRIYNLKKVDEKFFSMVKSNGYAFFFESLHVLNINNCKISEIPITLPNRTYGNSKMKVSDIFVSVKQLVRIFYINLMGNRNLIIKPKIETNIPETNESADWNLYWKKGKKNKIKFLYDLIAYFYRAIIIKPALNFFIRKTFKNKSKLLHAGCGSGQVDIDVTKNNSVTALDISIEALRLYKAHHSSHVELIHGNIFSIPGKKNSYDGIFNLGVMEHFFESEIIDILIEFNRVLKKNGKIILFWPPKYGLSVRFLSLFSRVFKKITKKEIILHPNEYTLVENKDQVEGILKKGGFKIDEYYFGIRDFYTHQIIVASKES